MLMRTATTKIETAIRLAQMIDTHEPPTEAERQEVFQTAREEGVSTFDYLRARILLRVTNGNASLVTEWLSQIECGGFDDDDAHLASQQLMERGEINQGTGSHLLRKPFLQYEE